jgi:hypothetical protein
VRYEAVREPGKVPAVLQEAKEIEFCTNELILVAKVSELL